MTVKQLMEILNNCNPESEVVISSDGEGNSYSPLADYNDELYYFPESTWSGECLSKEDLDYKDREYSEADRCVVLWPTN